MYLYNDVKLKNLRRKLRNQMPKPEQILWYYLRAKNLKGYKFRRQFSIDDYIVDFFCPKLKLAIEIDGDSHFLNSQTVAYGKIREQFLNDSKINVLRFTNDQVTSNTEGVLEKILSYLP